VHILWGLAADKPEYLIILSLSNSVGARLKDSAIIYRNEVQVTAEILLFGLYSYKMIMLI